MNILFIMIPVSMMLALFFLVSFISTVASGQMDDLETPAHRILNEDNGDTE